VKIVIAAENGFIRSSINVNLRSAGYQVTEAEPGGLLEVLTVLRNELPHLVVLEYELSLCSCETLVRIIREDPILFTVPLLLILDPLAGDAEERMSRWDHVQILMKPIQVGVLLETVRHFFPDYSIDSSDRESAV